MAWSDTGRKAFNPQGSNQTNAVALAGTAAGSLIVGGVSFWNATTPAPDGDISVSDSVNGAWASGGGEAFYKIAGGGAHQACALFYLKNNAGGALTITFTSAAANYDWDVFVHEFAGSGAGTVLSGTPVTATGTNTTPDTGNLVPTHQNVLLVAMLGVNSSGALTENRLGEGFTLSNEDEATMQMGSLVYKIISGNPGTVKETWTSASGSDWAAGIAAFAYPGAPAVGGGGSPGKLMSLGIG